MFFAPAHQLQLEHTLIMPPSWKFAWNTPTPPFYSPRAKKQELRPKVGRRHDPRPRYRLSSQVAIHTHTERTGFTTSREPASVPSSWLLIPPGLRPVTLGFGHRQYHPISYHLDIFTMPQRFLAETECTSRSRISSQHAPCGMHLNVGPPKRMAKFQVDASVRS